MRVPCGHQNGHLPDVILLPAKYSEGKDHTLAARATSLYRGHAWEVSEVTGERYQNRALGNRFVESAHAVARSL